MKKPTASAFGLQLAKLRKEAEKPARADRPERLSLLDFAFAPDVFQPRIAQGRAEVEPKPNMIVPRQTLRSDKHVDDLATILRNQPAEAKGLDPITVFAIGTRFYVLDGNHRLAAHEDAGVFYDIPVQHFAGTLEDAIGEAVRINAKVHLGMSTAERNEAAWRVVILQAHTVATQVAITGLSKRTICRMRSLLKEVTEKAGRVFDGSHRDALALSRQEGSGKFSMEEEDQIAADLAQQLGKAIGPQGRFPPATMAKALKIAQGDHYCRRMAETWREAQVEPLEEADGEPEVPPLCCETHLNEVPSGTSAPTTTRFVAHTDGSCLGNPGPGGFAAVVCAYADDALVSRQEITGGEAETTNNRQELRGAIEALKATAEINRGKPVMIVSDSRYVVDGASRFLAKWKLQGWKKADRKPVENRDLWEELDGLAAGRPVMWTWVRGHNGDANNEAVDQLAQEAARNAAASERLEALAYLVDKSHNEIEVIF